MKAFHYIKQSLVFFVSCLVGSLVYGLITSMGDDSLIWQNVLLISGSFMLVFGILMSLFFSTTLYMQTIPLTVSFGATRRGTFLGLQLGRVSYTLVTILGAGAFFLIASDTPFGNLIVAVPFVLAAFLVCHGLGGIMSILYVKFQKKGLIIFAAVLGFVLGVALGGFIVAFKSGNSPVIPDYFRWILDYFSWILLGAGAVFYGLISLWERRIIYRYNVKL